MSRAERFLDLYKNLEEVLSARKGHDKKRRYASPVLDFMNSQEGSSFREELNLCRDVRNLLSHHASFDGENAVEPAESLIGFLERLITYLENPPTAESICMPASQLMCAKRNDILLEVLSKMEERGFSHVPVLEGKRLYGVLSISTIFSYFRDHPDEKLGRDARVEKLWEELPLDKHTVERFEFASSDCAYDVLRERFSAGGPQKKRLAAVFVSKEGTDKGVLLGMITPWDMLRAEPDV